MTLAEIKALPLKHIAGPDCWLMLWTTWPHLLQRLRWAEGGVEMMIDFFRLVVGGRVPSLLPTYTNFVVSLVWAYCMLFALIVGILWSAGVPLPRILPGFQFVPEWWGLTLAVTYLAQALVSHLVERRYEPDMLRGFFWIIWYPLAFWLINTLTAVAALPRVLVRQRRSTWESPDRGLR
jgi:biofilm PGA synthesis N-glycosyltransferase PgaC